MQRVVGSTSRQYVSRAHPQQLPEYPLAGALQMVLDDAKERSTKRAIKWERNAPVRIKKGIQVRNFRVDR